MIVTEEQIALLSDLLKEYEPAYSNFQTMTLSVKKTYTRAYFDAKTEVGCVKRIDWMVDRLNKNLKPMWKYYHTNDVYSNLNYLISDRLSGLGN